MSRYLVLAALGPLVAACATSGSSYDAAPSTARNGPDRIRPTTSSGQPDAAGAAAVRTRVRFTTVDGTVTVALDENPTARDLIDRLPLTVDFEDFHTSEKISYLDAPLTTEGSGGSAPGPGDLIYYVPWGNLAVFYDGSVPHSDDTIPLGRVVDGAENVASLDRGPVTIERVAQKGNR